MGFRLPCPWLLPRVYSDSCPLSQGCYLVPPHPLPPPSPFPSVFSSIRCFSIESLLHIRWPKNWPSVSGRTSVLPLNIQDWFHLGWTGWISLQSRGLSRVFSNTTVQKASVLRRSAFFRVQLSHPYMTIGRNIALTILTLVGQVMSLLFNTV